MHILQLFIIHHYFLLHYSFTLFHWPNQIVILKDSKLKLSASMNWTVNFRRWNLDGSRHKEHYIQALVLARNFCSLFFPIPPFEWPWFVGIPMIIGDDHRDQLFFRDFYVFVIKDSRLHSHFASHRPQNDRLVRGPSTSLCARLIEIQKNRYRGNTRADNYSTRAQIDYPTPTLYFVIKSQIDRLS